MGTLVNVKCAYNLRGCDNLDPRNKLKYNKMTLPNEQQNKDALVSCQCDSNNCVDCKCGCNTAACCKSSSLECPFIKAHPDWRKCPFMSKMVMDCTCKSADIADHSVCDASKCSQIPVAQCTSCHTSPALTHTVTLSMDTETATDQTEETAL